MTFKQLNAGDQKLLKLMQMVDYGRLEQLSICKRSAHGQYPITNHGRMEISF